MENALRVSWRRPDVRMTRSWNSDTLELAVLDDSDLTTLHDDSRRSALEGAVVDERRIFDRNQIIRKMS